MVVHAYNPSTREVEAGASQVRAAWVTFKKQTNKNKHKEAIPEGMVPGDREEVPTGVYHTGRLLHSSSG
jgi:hypothetical protein